MPRFRPILVLIAILTGIVPLGMGWATENVPLASVLSSTPSTNTSDGSLDNTYRDSLIAFKLGHFAEASTACDQALKFHPNDPQALVLKGRIVSAQGDTTAAETWIKKGIAVDPSLSSSHRALGDLAFHQRHYEEARLSFLEAQRCGDSDKDLSLLLLYCALGPNLTKFSPGLTQAEQIFSSFNAFDEKTPAYYFGKAALARVQGRDEESRKALQDATVLYGNPLFAQYARDYFFLFASTH